MKNIGLCLIMIFLFSILSGCSWLFGEAKNKDDKNIVSTVEDPNDKRWIKQDCESIIDNETGLEWFPGPEKKMTIAESESWISALSNCGGGWRMATLPELVTIYLKNSNKSASALHHTFGDLCNPDKSGDSRGKVVWYKGNDKQYGVYYLAHGYTFNPEYVDFDSPRYVLAVRGKGEASYFPYEKTPCGSIVDKSTGNEWIQCTREMGCPDMDTLLNADDKYDMIRDILYDYSFTSCGPGFRLPTIAELKSLYRKNVCGYLQNQRSQVDLNLDTIFQDGLYNKTANTRFPNYAPCAWSNEPKSEKEGESIIKMFNYSGKENYSCSTYLVFFIRTGSEANIKVQ